MNDELMKPFVAEDVKKALFSIGLHAVFLRSVRIFWVMF
jgi:hypothetical protein